MACEIMSSSWRDIWYSSYVQPDLKCPICILVGSASKLNLIMRLFLKLPLHSCIQYEYNGDSEMYIKFGVEVSYTKVSGLFARIIQ